MKYAFCLPIRRNTYEIKELPVALSYNFRK